MIYIFGSSGQLGQALKKVAPQGIQTQYLSSSDLDITNNESLSSFFQNTVKRGDTIINCAAYTAVDRAEEEKEIAFKVNAQAVQSISKYCKEVGSNLVHISTDYVFDGSSSSPLTVDSIKSPINTYGLSKLDGEKEIIKSGCNYIIVRTSWVFSEFGHNFFKTMKKLSQKDSLTVVNDQIGSPTYAPDLAEVIYKLISRFEETNKATFHFSNSGQCSWYDFSKEIMHLLKSKTQICPIPSSEYPTLAKRPSYSLLDTAGIESFLNISIRSWQDALKHCIEESKNE
jgi:dTDP-4-dehydrorhamnose reductase